MSERPQEQLGPQSAKDRAMMAVATNPEIIEAMAESQIEVDLRQAYIDSHFIRVRNRQREQGRPVSVLFTDIDNTFYRRDRAAASAELAHLAEQYGYPIIAVTGNGYENVMDRIQQGDWPYFSIIAGSVGTEIWLLHEDEEGKKYYVEDREFARELKEKGFHRKQLAITADNLAKELKRTRPKWDLDFQKPELEQAYIADQTQDVQPFKISYYFYASSPEEVQEVAQLVSAHLPQQQILVCPEFGYNDMLVPEEQRRKYCLDIVPITKAGAVDYLRKLTGIEQGMVAGDSGNDIGMLVESERFPAVLVGGAQPEAENAIDQSTVEPSRGGGSFRTIVSRTGEIKRCYVERKPLLGPESIIRAAAILKRAENIARLRQSETKSTEIDNVAEE